MTATATESQPGRPRVDKLAEPRGIDQFALYAMHDAIESTMEQYGTHVIPAVWAAAC